MKKAWLSMVIVALVFGGCAGLRQFPEVSQDTKALESLDEEYNKALVQAYGTADAPKQVDVAQQKLIRSRLIEGRMAVIDAHFKTFESGLVKENVRVELGLSLLGIGVGAAGSLVAQTASQILSAVSGGLAGAQAAYGKSVLYDKAMSALLAQMHAGRKTIAAQIFQRWDLDIMKYPMWMARTDLDAYYFAGSLPGAILSTAADAKTKEAQADLILLSEITPESATPEMFVRRQTLLSAIDGLGADKAKRLVERIGAEFAEARKIFEARYTSDVQSRDTDGSAAKAVLRQAAIQTVRSQGIADKWQTVIGNL